MSTTDILLLAVALAMDCFTVSIVSGMVLRRWEWSPILRLSFLFGVFQAAMPLAGWLSVHASQLAVHGTALASYSQRFGHWVASALLLFLGLKMIREAFLPGERTAFDPRRPATQVTLSVATSIDALAVGISFAVTGFDTLPSLLWPLAAIGLASALFGLLGHTLGIHFGVAIGRKVKPALLGGVILIAIGVKIALGELL